MGTHNLRLLKTLPHACGYFADREATHVVLDPRAPAPAAGYATALRLGFRRAGGQVYRPHCASCSACVPCRIDVTRFRPDRGQRRCLRRNADLELRVTAPGLTAERHALYRRYLRARHPGGGMDKAPESDFDGFLDVDWSPTRFLELRREGALLAVAVTDVCATGASAVYTFFDPDLSQRSLGTCAILRQIEWTRARGLRHLYLGYWIAGHPKMDYKRRFSGLELLDRRGWMPLRPQPEPAA